MRTLASLLTLLLACFVPALAGATTWDEPWHGEVVRKAYTFGLYNVESVDGKVARLKLERHLAGANTPAEIELSGYSDLRETSYSSFGTDDELDPWLQPGQSYYLHLSPGKDRKWQLATPSAGSSRLRPDGIVEATYRISIHQALVPKATYESTQVCIFQVLHKRACALEPVKAFIAEALKPPVAVLSPSASESDMNRFFLQHAALETAALLQLPLPGDALQRFAASSFYHVEFSVLGYIAASSMPNKWHRIATFACDAKRNQISRRYAVQLLRVGDARAEAGTLRGCVKAEPAGQGGLAEVSDPRIGTAFPGELKKGIDDLLDSWNAGKAAPPKKK